MKIRNNNNNNDEHEASKTFYVDYNIELVDTFYLSKKQRWQGFFKQDKLLQLSRTIIIWS